MITLKRISDIEYHILRDGLFVGKGKIVQMHDYYVLYPGVPIGSEERLELKQIALQFLSNYRHYDGFPCSKNREEFFNLLEHLSGITFNYLRIP